MKPARNKRAHLMCGMPLWGIAGVLGCGYLAYLSYDHIRTQEFDWPHDPVFILTYGVWILFIVGLLTETKCVRERIFFTLLLANFAMGFTLAIRKDASPVMIRDLRIASSALWGLAALVSLVTAYSDPGKARENRHV